MAGPGFGNSSGAGRGGSIVEVADDVETSWAPARSTANADSSNVKIDRLMFLVMLFRGTNSPRSFMISAINQAAVRLVSTQCSIGSSKGE